METSYVQVPVGSSRKKLLYFTIIVIVAIAITTTGVIIYDYIREQDLHAAGQTAQQVQTLTALTSHGINASGTTGTQTTESNINPTRLSGVTNTSVSLEIPLATFDETTTTTTDSERDSSHISALLTTGVAFTTQVQLYDTSVSLKTPASTSVEQETMETEVISSQTPATLTSAVSFKSTIQKYTTSSTESITTDNTLTSKLTKTPEPNATIGYSTDCSEFNISVGLSVTQSIYPYGSADKIALVNCISTSDGIWTVIQRRFDGSVDFYRNWTDYKEGFGDASGEYWLGNDAIYQLTSRSNHKLKVILKDLENITVYLICDAFRISAEIDNYRLTIERCHGDAGDSLQHHNGQMFSTRDRDNDISSSHCAVDHKGAWWYRNCYYSNLNGHYFNERTYNTTGMIWFTFSAGLSLKETSMMIQN